MTEAMGKGVPVDKSSPESLSHRSIHALLYLAQGFAIVPLGNEQSSGVTPKRPHPRCGTGWSFTEGGGRAFVGTRDPAVARNWWRMFPSSNLGVITGTASALLVVDCDRHGKPVSVSSETQSVRWGDLSDPRDGVTNFAAWADRHDLDLSSVPTVDTPSGGVHYYFRWVGEVPPRWVGWLPGVDLLGSGGLAVAPSSKGYSWRAPLEVVPNVPDVLRAVFQEPRGRSTVTGSGGAPIGSGGLPSNDWFIANGLGAYTGSRDQDAYRLAWRLLNGPEDQMIAVLYRAWQAAERKDHPFTWDDVMKCVESARRRRGAEAATLRWEAGGVL